MRTTCLLKVTVPSALAERLMTKRRTAAPKVLNHMGRYFTRCASVCIHPSSQRRGVCAEGADGVVRPAKRFAELTTPALRATPPLRGGEWLGEIAKLKTNGSWNKSGSPLRAG